MRKHKLCFDQRGIGLILELVLIGLVLVVAVVAVGTALKQAQKGSNKTPTPTNTQSAGPLRGVALTPKTYDAAGFTDFYQQAKTLGSSVSWHGDWAELGDKSKAPYSVARTARQHGLEPIILVGTHHETAGKAVAIRPLTTQTRADYKRWAAEYAGEVKPRYFGMGNEVNTIAATAPADFEALVGLVNETAAEVKRRSPETKVFVTFQLERMKGLNGGLFGGKNDPSRAQWELLKRFEVDVLAFTTYPGLIYHSPADLPSDYYDEIRARTDKELAFSEVGWAAADVASGWASSPSLQEKFADRFLGLVNPLEPKFCVWLLLYDAQTGAAFRSMGLIDHSGAHRPAFNTWRSR